jgi:hypothetical protein
VGPQEASSAINYRLDVVGYKHYQLFTPNAVQEVEINGLANLDAIDREWEIALTDHWIALADNSSGK